MWICLLYLGTVLAVPTDEFRAIVHEGDLSPDLLLKQIIPSGYSPQIINENTDSHIPNIDNKDNEHFITFNDYVEKGVTEKGLTFNIYDDDMRNAAIALFRLLRDTRIYNRVDYEKIKKWANANVNSDMYDYAKRLTSLYSISRGSEETLLPPFIFKPNYFVNGETIMKAMFIKNNNGQFSDSNLKNQVFRIDKRIIINSNYSGWNIPLNGCDEKISYFKDDATLNSYYYGVHLRHPYWMPNEELDEINPKHPEHFYYIHQQLLARYRLEKEHLGTAFVKSSKQTCEPEYNPYLYYENGLAFPTRSSILGDMQENITYLKSIDIAIKECIYRGLVFLNGTFIKMSSDNYIGLMTKLIRANLDGVKSAKIVRSIFGYGNNGYPLYRYNPTPSLLHHPQTTLRDPVYWSLIERGLDYFSEFTNNSEPLDISKYETNEFEILQFESSKLVTIFDYNLINLNKALQGDTSSHNGISNNNIYSRQRKLNHLPFNFNFTVVSTATKDVIIRLFLGPHCKYSCWDSHSRFFELDSYRNTLTEGINNIIWDPESSERYVYYSANDFENDNENGYNIYKFPRNLVLPKGSEVGLNLTVFVMITEDDNLTEIDATITPVLYHQFSSEIDSKPLGFPFHKHAESYSDSAPNYRFFNVTVYHMKTLDVDFNGYFSPHLY
ncbi:basic juvenile hormone-suppressible protein 2-like [Ostrinia nubilalis]|uniref:basic juvenile hormone-suppressible protein 2-like n=1 Tax=Ostrinia nubilalis TaxID=29057 RepID=UPI0030822AAC